MAVYLDPITGKPLTTPEIINVCRLNEPSPERFKELLEGIPALDNTAFLDLTLKAVALETPREHQLDAANQFCTASLVRKATRLMGDERDKIKRIVMHPSVYADFIADCRINDSNDLLENMTIQVTNNVYTHEVGFEPDQRTYYTYLIRDLNYMNPFVILPDGRLKGGLRPYTDHREIGCVVLKTSAKTKTDITELMEQKAAEIKERVKKMREEPEKGIEFIVHRDPKDFSTCEMD